MADFCMADIFKTILPIFVIIFLGWSLRHLDFMQEGFVKPANRLVYFVAIPAMIFREIATAELAEHFRLVLVAATLGGGYPIARINCIVGRISSGAAH
jgi:predicted permease